ncbi:MULTISPECIES: phospho-sugar mutase [Erysipelotrichaceae]|uniref:phospho-sugar mutase n=1 Tax=Erysipelotrichaceae TaxID=128827 RepID=UPI00272B91F3|nr:MULTISPECIES: phospho-sugar mutase [Erysipelotrichaceae]
MDKFLYSQWMDNLPDKDKQTVIAYSDDNRRIAFLKYLDFGTGGMRGKLGIGPNMVNKYVANKLAGGIADYLNAKSSSGKPKVVIAYDNRYESREIAASMENHLANDGINVEVLKDSNPTPLLAFSVNEIKADLGIMITASHNSKEYNGIKLYNSKGIQLVPQEAKEIRKYYLKCDRDIFHEQKVHRLTNRQSPTIAVMHHYLEKVNYTLSSILGYQGDKIKDLRVVFSPLHGVAGQMVSQLANLRGFKNFYIVEGQYEPDPSFHTIRVPNPEDSSSFEEGLKLAKNVTADIVICTDADGDRVGVAVRDNDMYSILDGNQLAILLTFFICNLSMQEECSNVIFKTIVTSNLVERIASARGVTVINTLTGFKYIGNSISQLPKDTRFLLAVEESNGYLVGDYLRDKDGILGSLLVMEMVQYYKNSGKNIIDILKLIYEEYGYYFDRKFQAPIEKNQIESIEKLKLRIENRLVTHIAGKRIDYINGLRLNLDIENDLGKMSFVEDIFKNQNDILYLSLSDGSWICIRPSGTEPKIKLYVETKGANKEEAKKLSEEIEMSFFNLMKECEC